MIYSHTASYAITLLLRLAELGSDRRTTLDEVLDGMKLSRHFAAKILQRLARAGLLDSVRGRGGGFTFSRSPSEIHLMEVIKVFDTMEQYERCILGYSACDEHQPCPHHEEWQPIRDQIVEYLHNTTLEQFATGRCPNYRHVSLGMSAAHHAH
jgi:Rrf2 family protein